MRSFAFSAMAAIALLSFQPDHASAQPPTSRAVHDSVLVLDSHADVLLPSTPRNYYLPDGGSRVSLDRLIAGGVDAVVLSVAVGSGPETPEGDAAARAEADEKLAAIQAFVAGSGGRAELARSAADVERLHRAGKTAVILGFLNARSLGDDLAAFDRYRAAGVLVAGLNHAGHNRFSDSSRPGDGPQERHMGLSRLGRAAVRRFNDLGVLIDVSQLSSAALRQTLELTRAPVVASHSNARALADNSRSLSDAELAAIKANGGVVQVTPFPAYLKTPTLKAFVDQIDYIAKQIGVDHVGVGSDFNHGAGVPGFDSAADAPNVTAELLRRGYTSDQIAAIWGGNFLRVLRAAEAARKR